MLLQCIPSSPGTALGPTGPTGRYLSGPPVRGYLYGFARFGLAPETHAADAIGRVSVVTSAGVPRRHCARAPMTRAIEQGDMRVLVYGMQSSGASLVTVFLGQAPRSVAVVDLWNSQLMPPLQVRDADHVIGKAVVTTAYSFEDHALSFKPDRTLLVLRDPAQNFVSLRRKYYSDENGTLAEKFGILEQVFSNRDRFDLTLRYEDFVLHPDRAVAELAGIGLPAEASFFAFSRDAEEMRDFAFSQSDWCRANYEKKWKFGNVHGSALRSGSLHKLVPASVSREVRALCPTLVSHYEGYFAEEGLTPLRRYSNAVWHDAVVPSWRRLVARGRRLASAGHSRQRR